MSREIQRDFHLLSDFVLEKMKEHRIPGLAVAVSRGDEIVYMKGFGFRNVERQLPVTADTVFGVASVTKSFTALAIMQLQERGLLSVQDRVTKYLPEFGRGDGYDDEVTIHHFLTHTAGFPPLPSLGISIRGNTAEDRDRTEEDCEPDKSSKVEKEPRRIDTYEQLIEFMKSGEFTLLGKPGEYCSYSNECYGLLGLIIQRITSVPYEEYMKANILSPLSMGRSVFGLDDLREMDDVTSLYYKDAKDEVKCSDNWQVAPPFVACGWLKSCVSDLMNYTRMYIGRGSFNGEKIVSPDSVSAMMEQHTPYNRDSHYGYGLSIQPYHGVTLVGHSGSLKGAASNFTLIPEMGISAVVLTNLSGAPASQICHGAINFMLGLPPDTPKSLYIPVAWNDDQYSRVAGTYRSGEGSTIVIEYSQGRLLAKSDDEEYEITPCGDRLGTAKIRGQESEVGFYIRDDRCWAIRLGGRVIPRADV